MSFHVETPKNSLTPDLILTSSTVAQDDEVLVLLSGSHWGLLLCCCAKQFPFCSQCLSHKGGGWKCSVCRRLSGRRQFSQAAAEKQSYGSVLLLSLRPHLRLHICLIKRKQEVKIKMLHSSNYRFDRGQNQPAKGVSNIRTGEQNLTVKDASPAHWAALENMKECIDF